MKNKIALSLFIIAVAFGSCKKVQRTAFITDGDYMTGMARLKVVYAAPGLRAMNIVVASAKLNGTSLTYGSVFPSPNTNSDYSVVPAGTGAVSLIYPATAARPDSVYKTLTYAFLGDRNYSLIITDSVARPNKAIFLTDDFAPMTDSGYYKLRFINAMANATAAVDLYSMRQGTNIASNIPYSGATPFIKLQMKTTFTPSGAITNTDTLIMRTAGTATELARINGFLPPNQRAINVYARGSFTATSGTAARGLQTYYSY